jgi:hypothetical protein
LRGKRDPSGPVPEATSRGGYGCGLSEAAGHLTSTCPHPTSRHVITGTILCSAFPRRASVGHKLYTAAWSRMLRPTRKCGPCGFRWPRHGRSSLKRWSGYSRIKGWVMQMARDRDEPKSLLEAPPMPCPRCKTLMKVRKRAPLPGLPRAQPGARRLTLAGTRSDRRCLVVRSGFGVCLQVLARTVHRARPNLIDCGFLRIRSSSRQCPGSAGLPALPPCGFPRCLCPVG